jgi:hypothetical protein
MIVQHNLHCFYVFWLFLKIVGYKADSKNGFGQLWRPGIAGRDFVEHFTKQGRGAGMKILLQVSCGTVHSTKHKAGAIFRNRNAFFLFTTISDHWYQLLGGMRFLAPSISLFYGYGGHPDGYSLSILLRRIKALRTTTAVQFITDCAL